MANIYVGFHDQRSSSRILKPPGGGTSDIFGTDALKAKKEEDKSLPNTPTKGSVDTNDQNAPIPEEKSDTNGVSETKPENNSNSEEPKIENLSINEEKDEKSSEATNENKAETKPDSIGSIIRQEDKVQSPVVEPAEKKSPQRVPPGGFSSGLW